MLRKKRAQNKSKKFALIVKKDSTNFAKWKVNKIDNFILFLNKKYPTWCYINVFDNVTKLQIDSIINPNKEHKKYTVIVRVDAQTVEKNCKKWNVDDYEKPLISWLNSTYPNWKWIDVYDKASRKKIDHINQFTALKKGLMQGTKEQTTHTTILK